MTSLGRIRGASSWLRGRVWGATLQLLAPLAAMGCTRAEVEVATAAASGKPTSAVAWAPGTAATQASALPPQPTPEASASRGEGSERTERPPLTGQALVSLEVPGFQPAVVAVPLGARSPRPVAVALHGNFDRPEWQCGVWAPIVAQRGFVVCPRGVARRDVAKSWDRWEYASARAMSAEIEAALTALGARFPDHVDAGPRLFIGFSLGAIYGTSLVQKAPERFPRVVLIEGGTSGWSAASAKRFAAGGGARLLFACGQPGCMAQSKGLASLLERAGLPARFGGDPRAGHTYDGNVAAVVQENWDWLLEGDERWTR